MRLALFFTLGFLLLPSSGCQSGGGAVSVRWHIVDLTNGQIIDPQENVGPNGSCTAVEPDMSSLRSWTITRIRLIIADPDTGDEVLAPSDMRVEFPCSQREATTPFSLPLGTFAMSLRATSPDQTITPAPAVRTIKRAEVVNLDVVEIGIHPLPLAPLDAGSIDLSVPDGGPVS